LEKGLFGGLLSGRTMKAVKTLLLVAATLMAADFAFAQTWMLTSAPTNSPGYFVASSADGSKLAAAMSYQIYTSTNSGTSWATNNVPSSVFWRAIASSADGSKLAVVAPGVGIYTSTNSGGVWTQTLAPANTWQSIASSADGCVLVAAAVNLAEETNGWIYISTNSGNSRLPTTAPTNYYWASVAASADGCKLVAAAGRPGDLFTGAIYTSTNTGASWEQTSATNNIWVTVASSADGRRLVASAEFCYAVNSNNVSELSPGGIWTSPDSGTTWISNNVPFEPNGWIGVASSADGVKLVATSLYEGTISISTNSGATWNSNSIPGINFNNGSTWASVASSADGNQLVAVAAPLVNNYNYSGIYIYQTTPSPQLNVLPAGSNLAISWLIPSTNFVVQQSSDLISWVDLTNTPTLNLTNLNNELIISPTNSSGFYRLNTP
jgi:hypothetical protein